MSLKALTAQELLDYVDTDVSLQYVKPIVALRVAAQEALVRQAGSIQSMQAQLRVLMGPEVCAAESSVLVEAASSYRAATAALASTLFTLVVVLQAMGHQIEY